MNNDQRLARLQLALTLPVTGNASGDMLMLGMLPDMWLDVNEPEWVRLFALAKNNVVVGCFGDDGLPLTSACLRLAIEEFVNDGIAEAFDGGYRKTADYAEPDLDYVVMYEQFRETGKIPGTCPFESVEQTSMTYARKKREDSSDSGFDNGSQ